MLLISTRSKSVKTPAAPSPVRPSVGRRDASITSGVPGSEASPPARDKADPPPPPATARSDSPSSVTADAPPPDEEEPPVYPPPNPTDTVNGMLGDAANEKLKTAPLPPGVEPLEPPAAPAMVTVMLHPAGGGPKYRPDDRGRFASCTGAIRVVAVHDSSVASPSVLPDTALTSVTRPRPKKGAGWPTITTPDETLIQLEPPPPLPPATAGKFDDSVEFAKAPPPPPKYPPPPPPPAQ